MKNQPISNEQVDYTGHFQHGIDASRRVMFPAKWRPSDPNSKFTIIPWPIGAEDRLLVLPPERWREMVTKLKSRSLSDARAAALEQEIAENAVQVVVDKVGRICLSEDHANRIRLTKDATLVGRLDKFEIWEPEAHKAKKAETRKLAAEAAREFDL